MDGHAIAIADTFAKALSHQIATPDARHALSHQIARPHQIATCSASG